MRSVLLLLLVAASAKAAPLTVTTSGRFDAAITPTTLASPGAIWRLSFNIDRRPAAFNAGLDGFDAPFDAFQYTLNGTPVGSVPESIRFLSAANAGGFTLFFGPETGVGANGDFIPELSVFSPQLWTGTPQQPAFAPSTNTVSEWLYTDDVNFDDQPSPGTSVTVSAVSAVPEPTTLILVGVAIATATWIKTRRRSWPGPPSAVKTIAGGTRRRQ